MLNDFDRRSVSAVTSFCSGIPLISTRLIPLEIIRCTIQKHYDTNNIKKIRHGFSTRHASSHEDFGVNCIVTSSDISSI